MRSRPDVAVCRGCLSWLREQSGVVDVTATLPVSDLDRSTSFYEAAGFDVGVRALTIRWLDPRIHINDTP